MKVNLLLSGDGPRSGFLNIDPFAPPDDALKTRGDICNLDEYVDDAECDELIALDVLDFLPSPELDNVLDNWIRKIRHGGTIVIGGVDIREVANGLIRQELTLEQANKLLYGTQTAPFDYRKASLTLQKLVEIFQARGFKILQKRVSDFFYHVKAERE